MLQLYSEYMTPIVVSIVVPTEPTSRDNHFLRNLELGTGPHLPLEPHRQVCLSARNLAALSRQGAAAAGPGAV